MFVSSIRPVIFNFGCMWESPGRPKKYWYVGSARPVELLGMEPRLLNSGDSDADCELNTPASDSRPLKDKNHPFLTYTEYIQYLAQCLAHSISELFIEVHWMNDAKISQLLTCSSIHSLHRHFLPSAWAHVNFFPSSDMPASSFSQFMLIHFSGLCLTNSSSRSSYQHPREKHSRSLSYHSLCFLLPPHLTCYFGR